MGFHCAATRFGSGLEPGRARWNCQPGPVTWREGAVATGPHLKSRLLAATARGPTVGLRIVPISRAEAFAFVQENHRHHGCPAGSVFQIAVADGDKVVGVAVVGRPVARMLDNGWTLEVNRVCTDGHRNACSMLYGAAWRAAKALGYKKVVTYTLPEEGGASLRAAGWKCIGQAGGGSWHRESRPRVDTHPTQVKFRWEVVDGNQGEASPGN